MLTRVRRSLSERLDALVDARADARALAVFRVVFAVVGIVYATRVLGFVTFRWHGHAASTVNLARMATIAWIVALVALLLGLGGRLGRAAQVAQHLLAIAAISYEATLGNSAQEALFIIPSFWLVFMRVDDVWSVGALRRVETNGTPRAWPVWLLGINVGLVFFGAAVSKMLDPLWLTGDGFYYAFHLPWIKLAHLDGAVDRRWLMLVLNYFVILLEFAALPLFVFRRTRWVSVLMLVAFYLGLIYPFRLDLIGPHGLAGGLALVSITSWPRRGERRALPEPVPSSAGREVSLRRVGVALALAAMVVLYLRGYAGKWTRSRDTSATSATLPPPPAARGRLRTLLRTVNLSTIWAIEWTLFTKEHTQGIYLYRVQVVLEGGTRVEPLVVFERDKHPGPLSRGFEPRFLQAAIYPLSDYCNVRSYFPAHAPDSVQERTLRALTRLAVSRAGERAVSAELSMSPITMPDAYRGNARPWEAAPWTPLYHYDVAAERFAVTQTPMPRALRQGRVKHLPNYF